MLPGSAEGTDWPPDQPEDWIASFKDLRKNTQINPSRDGARRTHTANRHEGELTLGLDCKPCEVRVVEKLKQSGMSAVPTRSGKVYPTRPAVSD